MECNKLFRPSVGADYTVSKNKTDLEIGPYFVTLSEAKGLSRWASRCFAAAQHDSPVTYKDYSINLFMCIVGTYEYPG